jgi:hypothetical protein
MNNNRATMLSDEVITESWMGVDIILLHPPDA